MAGHVARMGKMRNSFKVLVGRRNVKKPLGRSRHTQIEGKCRK